MPEPWKMLGSAWGRLTVQAERDQIDGRRMWQCHCQCGAETIVWGGDLFGGVARNCGCVPDENNWGEGPF